MGKINIPSPKPRPTGEGTWAQISTVAGSESSHGYETERGGEVILNIEFILYAGGGCFAAGLECGSLLFENAKSQHLKSGPISLDSISLETE
jgi:hypothetical protein